MDLHTIVFSKDRPLQLDATLRSLAWSAEDGAERMRVSVIALASDARQQDLYRRVAAEHPAVRILPESGFQATLLAALDDAPLIAFVVDDAIFVRRWRVAAVRDALQRLPGALGCSLRLGRNTTYCYSLDRPQRVPPMTDAGDGLLAFEWARAEHDFGYPLELSSSVYRLADLRPLLQAGAYKNPNKLEGVLHEARGRFVASRPLLLCAPRTLAFCAPLNMVQQVCANRAGQRAEYEPEALTAAYAAGRRIRVEALQGYTPRACHEEIDLPFSGPDATPPAAPASSPPEPDERQAWQAKGFPSPPPPVVQAEEVRALARERRLKILIETGASRAAGTAEATDGLEALVSIGADPASARPPADRRVLHLDGDPAALLPAVLARLGDPALFWFHPRGGSEAGPAIVSALRAVADHPVRGHAVVIDEARRFGAEPGFPTVRQVSALVATWAGHELDVALDQLRIVPVESAEG